MMQHRNWNWILLRMKSIASKVYNLKWKLGNVPYVRHTYKLFEQGGTIFIIYLLLSFYSPYCYFFLNNMHLHCIGNRPSKWIHRKDVTFLADPQPSVADSITAHLLNFIIIDKIIYLSQQLKVLNESVRVLQIATFHQRQIVDEQETERQQNVHGKIEAHATLVAGKFLSSNVKSFQSVTQKMTEIFRSILPAPVIADAGTVQSYGYVRACICTFAWILTCLQMRSEDYMNTHKDVHVLTLVCM